MLLVTSGECEGGPISCLMMWVAEECLDSQGQIRSNDMFPAGHWKKYRRMFILLTYLTWPSLFHLKLFLASTTACKKKCAPFFKNKNGRIIFRRRGCWYFRELCLQWQSSGTVLQNFKLDVSIKLAAPCFGTFAFKRKVPKQSAANLKETHLTSSHVKPMALMIQQKFIQGAAEGVGLGTCIEQHSAAFSFSSMCSQVVLWIPWADDSKAPAIRIHQKAFDCIFWLQMSL